MKNGTLIILLIAGIFSFCFLSFFTDRQKAEREPVEYVNPYIGNISHLLVPTYPTVHLPNSMLRVHPLREDFTGNKIAGLPVFLTSHRGPHVFRISPSQGESSVEKPVIFYEYDNEVVKPYFYSVYLDNVKSEVRFAPSHQSAIYEIEYKGKNTPCLIITTDNGELEVDNNVVSGWQFVPGKETKVYLYLETDSQPVDNTSKSFGKEQSIVIQFKTNERKVRARYGISLISVEQAKKNLRREITTYDLDAVAMKGREIWNEALGKIKVEGGSEKDKRIFYTSLYRTYERMINISEDGMYYSGFDGKIHADEGIPFYNDDWLWDTYRATHPLRAIIETEKEAYMIHSFIRMAEQMGTNWMPTFPEITGDSRRMNSNHGVATVIDCYEKGIRGFDLEKAYEVCKKAITEKSLAPWASKEGGSLDHFYKDHGYFPALAEGEIEDVPEVHSFERRQPVSVTLGTVYNEWCLANIARHLGKDNEYRYFLDRSLNYRKLFNSQTRFFHPKDKNGNFVEPFDYRYSGGLGGRDAYCENNGWVYRWDIQHNIADLVELMGGKIAFIEELERMYDTPLGKAKYKFYSHLPDHTGNVGQFSMGNEPALHIPYLYSYAGEPWRTQKRVRTLLDQWFRDDLMGVPGDEDGGGMSAFVVFSQLGFYPVTPGLPIYVIGSPVFEKAEISLENGNTFKVICHNYAPEHKYIQSARLNGKDWNKAWFHHEDLMQGGDLEFVMGKYPNKQWGASLDAIPPSFKMN